MNVEHLRANVERGMTAAGITILLANVCSRLFFASSAFDTPEREAWRGAVDVSAWLTLLWVIIAVVFLAIRGGEAGTPFQKAFVLNVILALLLFAEFCFSR